jgi:hypothetical protein
MNTPAFPPVNTVINAVTSIDYAKHLNNFMETIEIAIAIVLMIADVAVFVWNNGGKETLLQICQNVKVYSTISWNWFIQTGVPAVENAIQKTYDAGKKTREVWDMLNSPMFATL